MKAGIITQARTTSTRLPNKVFKSAGDKPLLKYHIDRLKNANESVIIATTTNPADDEITRFAIRESIPFYRGDEQNVLSRFYEAAKASELDIIIRTTSDCPLIDGSLIKEAIDNYIAFNDPSVYYSNCLNRTFPRGFDFEIFSFPLLEDAFLNAQSSYEKEHVTPYIHQNVSGNVIIKDFIQDEDYSNYRLTVDTQEDFELIKVLIEEFNCHEKRHREICEILDKNPELVLINQHIEQKKT